MIKLLKVSFFFSLLLTGFASGIGFSNAVGYLPAIAITQPEHLIPFWQNADLYFADRMKPFGISLQLSLLITIILQIKQWRTVSFWLLLAALGSALLDMITILTENLPTNQYIQAIPKDAPVPDDFDQYRQMALQAHYKRCFFMIASFVMTLFSFFLYRKTKSEPVLVNQ